MADKDIIIGPAPRDFREVYVRIGSDSVIWRCRLNVRFTPDKQTSTGTVRRSDKCHKQTHAVQQKTYSITSSARAESPGGTSSPRVLAVLRLITNSNLVA
jgi:hypothetical protein